MTPDRSPLAPHLAMVDSMELDTDPEESEIVSDPEEYLEEGESGFISHITDTEHMRHNTRFLILSCHWPILLIVSSHWSVCRGMGDTLEVRGRGQLRAAPGAPGASHLWSGDIGQRTEVSRGCGTLSALEDSATK